MAAIGAGPNRRRFLRGSLALAGLGLLAGCGLPALPWQQAETVPGLARVGVVWNPPNPTYGPVLKELGAAARTLGLELQRLEVRIPADLEGAVAAAIRQGAGALIAPADPLTTNRPKVVADLALKHRLPALMERREFVEAGGLLSLGRTWPTYTAARQPTCTRS